MLFKNPVRTSKRTPHFTITKINWLTLFKFNYEPLYILNPSEEQRTPDGAEASTRSDVTNIDHWRHMLMSSSEPEEARQTHCRPTA
jgi:hypothetical protein